MDKSKENLFRAIRAIIDSMPLPFDQTKIGRVTEILSNDKYKVQIKDHVYTIKSKFYFSVGERVFVLFPCGNDKDLYIHPNYGNGDGGDNPDIIVSKDEPSLDSADVGDIWIKI